MNTANNYGNPKLPQIPQGGMLVGGKVYYPDSIGNLYSTPGGAINSNMGSESAMSRGASGGCSQNADNVPYTPWKSPNR